MFEIDLYKETVEKLWKVEAELYQNHYSERDIFLAECLVEALAKARDYDQAW